MPIAEETPRLSPDEYLEWEKAQGGKHEYVEGEVFAMAGASDAHATVALNLASLLRNQVRGGPCRVFMADMKVRVALEGPFFYPDAIVTCDERDRTNAFFKEYPLLVIEVLSPTTAGFDRGKKFAWYRSVESLREYVLVDTEERSVECFRKDPNGRWVLHPFGPGDEVTFESLGFRCAMDAVYEDVAVA